MLNKIISIKFSTKYIMFKNIFGRDPSKKTRMTHEEALEIVMANYDRTQLDKFIKTDKIPTGDQLQDYADSLVEGDKQLKDFNDAQEIISVLKAMRLETHKLVDHKDIEKINHNKKLSEAIDVLAKSSRPEIAVYSMVIGAKSVIILFFLAMLSNNQSLQKLDGITKANLLLGGMAGGAAAGLLVSESGYRRRREEDISNAKISDILIIREGISKKLELPESLATQVNKHIFQTEFEEVFEKLDEGNHDV
jgi:hypothetical protein